MDSTQINNSNTLEALDCISRQAALDAIRAISDHGDSARANALGLAEYAVEALPPVQPKHGKWLPDNRCGGGYWVCSSCKYPTEAFAADVLYKYCPFCGADMRGDSDGTD